MGSHRISMDSLRVFCSAAQHLSFTRAAIELSLTQSAISHTVRGLETQLRVPLFRRVNRSLELTYAGEVLYRAAQDALDLVGVAVDRLSGAAQTLSITTTTALASLWLVPRLSEFVQAHPETGVRIAASNQWLDLDRDDIDIAIRYLSEKRGPGGAEWLVDYRTFPVCSPALLASTGAPLQSPSDLASHARLDFDTVVYGRPWYDWVQWFKALDIDPVSPVRTHLFSHYDQVIQAALDGCGVAIGKWPHLARYLEQGTLVAPFGCRWVADLGGFRIELGPKASRREDAVAFVSWLRDAIRRDSTFAAASLADLVA